MKKNFILLENNEVSDEDIKLINKFTNRNFDKSEVYVFSATLSDNEVDKQNEKFTIKSLEILSKLLLGKTGIINHNGTEKQYAKIFSCKIEVTKNRNSLGENYCKLVAKIYIPRTKMNENLILEIDSSIKERVNIHYSIDKDICSICNNDLKTCAHKKGEKYTVHGSEMLCYSILDNPTNVYEWSIETSFVKDNSPESVKVFSVNNKNEESSENIIKKLKSITNNNKLYKLYRMIELLEGDVSIGRKYVSELKNDVMKHFSFLNPQIDNLSLKKMVDVLTIDDLEKMKKRFSNSTMKVQLFTSKKANLNREYKI